MKDTSYTRGTKRVEIEEPECHWAWQVVAVVIYCAGAWLFVDWFMKGIVK